MREGWQFFAYQVRIYARKWLGWIDSIGTCRMIRDFWPFNKACFWDGWVLFLAFKIYDEFSIIIIDLLQTVDFGLA